MTALIVSALSVTIPNKLFSEAPMPRRPRQRPLTWDEMMSEIELAIADTVKGLLVPRVPKPAREYFVAINERLSALMRRR